MSSWPVWQTRFHNAARGMAVLAAFSLPMPTAWISISMSLLLLFWILGGDYKIKLARIGENPVAIWSLPLLAMLAIGVSYSAVDSTDAWDKVSSYAKLLYIPLLISVLDKPEWYRAAALAFLAAMLVVLTTSYLQYFGLLPLGPPMQEYTLFKSRIAQNFFMAFTAYIFIDSLIHQPQWRWLWAGLSLLALYNVMVMVPGRTGQVVLLFLIMLTAVKYLKWHGALIGTAVVLLLLTMAYQLSDQVRQRIDTTQQELAGFIDNDSNKLPAFSRWVLYPNTLEVIAKSPWFGHGSGSFAVEYDKVVAATGRGIHSDNPHNEYMHLWAQIGLIGFVLFAILLWQMWRQAPRLEPPYNRHGEILVAAMAIGCLFNSFLMDHGEGSFFVVLTGIYFAGLSKTSLAGADQT
ncbi:MAG: O-antigen ligase family protein [Pseudomonadota bacterium]